MLFSGDYVATGGANLTDNNGDGLRETYISSSSSTVNIIPSTATVEAPTFIGPVGPEVTAGI